MATAAALAVSACSRSGPGTRANPHVSITRVTDYGQDLFDTVRRILAEHRVDVKGRRVLLKPNLVEFRADAPINTHPRVVHAVLEGLRSLGAGEVLIGEGSGHRRGSLDMAEAAGYIDEIPRFEDLFTDLNFAEVSKVSLVRPAKGLTSLYLPKIALGADLLVSLPKMKTHHWAGATLAMKNLFGVVPGGVYGWPKNLLHWSGIPESIAALHAVFPRQFCLIDGIVGMEGNGPVQGTAVRSNVIVAGADPIAVDSTACRIMGLQPEKVKYLSMAAGHGQLKENGVIQIGDPIHTVAMRFARAL